MENERRLEILGILIIALAVFILVSITGYNANEEPSIVFFKDNKVVNSMGPLGVLTSHLFIKLGFGYASIILPILGLVWGWFLFAKKNWKELIRGSLYGLGTMFLISITIGVISI